ncbi:histone-lysine N-methyltransferase ASHH2 [Daucus carota subsp. sativus]|uniref:histone-lysine N-methyltransferase ASHH2 n=1 Tax=Daucus carota subsp. sativus TaxID=79200 RepID=UPI0007F037BF|nr:PREDICTED: histone-lysine N-methyltransferase ASHH2-like [Daucus carota subsp. sativus]XP_017252163.1 PREDICTED: histone-lysine N-methyltransferase ASHH2-like [Daucus carota subsp. sativus]
MASEMVMGEENVSVSGEGGLVADRECGVENLSVSMQSCEPFCTAQVDSLESFVGASDTVGANAISGALDNISIAESSREKQEEKDTVGSQDFASESTVHDAICSSLRARNSTINGPLLKTDTARPLRKCKMISNKKVFPGIEILELARRRRSCFSNRPRVSDWGSLETIGHVFNVFEDANLDQIEQKESRKCSGSKGETKRKNNRRRTNSLGTKKEIPASTGGIRLTVTFGDIIPGVVDDHKSSSGMQIISPKYNKDFEKKFEEGTSGTLDGHGGIGAQTQVGLSEEAVGSRCLDPGTSPDSEVINLIAESQTDEKVAEDDILNKRSCVSGEISSLSLPKTFSRKGKKKNEPSQDDKGSVNDEPSSPEIIDDTGVADQHRHMERTDNGFSTKDSVSITTGNITSKTSSAGVCFTDTPLQPYGVSSSGVLPKTFEVENCLGGGLCSPAGFQLETLEKCNSFTEPRDHENSENSRSPGSRLEFSEAKSLIGNSYVQKGDQFNLKARETSDPVQAVHMIDNYSKTGSHTFTYHGELKTGCSITPDTTSLKMNGVGDEQSPPRNAWVSCDNCYKWRRIPALLADSIEDTKSSWTCKDNVDEEFSDCSIPQEKSNAEINAELDLSDASCEDEAGASLHKPSGPEKKKLTASKQSTWKLIRLNHFLHRARRTQTIDEIMVCHCKAPVGGRMGCGNGCLNRMLNIECVKGTCPCGELCSNNQFQKRKYAKLKCFRSGKKGYGLQLLEDIHEGQFLIEYVGEVLDMHAYEDRQKEYALDGHKHFYFMTLNGSEVIDACAKGNLGRFINHSCEPNCRTEKWMVNGEVCVGLFALKDIKKGEEVTFDYNYVRVFGAAAKKCVCGSSLCRGYIGGDPSSGEIIVQDDSDEENLESVIVCEDSDDYLDATVSASSFVEVTDTRIAEKDVLGNNARAIEHSEGTEKMHASYSLSKQRKETNVDNSAAGCMVMSSSIEESTQETSSGDTDLKSVAEMDGMIRLPASVQAMDTFMQLADRKKKILAVAPPEPCLAEEESSKSLSTTQSFELSTTKLSRSSVDKSSSRRKLKDDLREDRSVITASHPNAKTSHTTSSLKKVKPRKSDLLSKNSAERGNKLHPLPYRSRKTVDSSSSDPFEAVQVKLNELLDSEGGISKRKDASRGYLKLLFLTAASGGSGNGEAIQSNRDLSMILDALLKTKSRTVLADVINKNGLQMLHNIMKRCRKEFHKIPILRKLLKVLQYLALREILTPEHITSGPHCAGVESFRESILSLTEHDDKQVHQITRNFRDRWIPRPIRKNSYMDRDSGKLDFNRVASNSSRLSPLQSQSSDSGARHPESVECIKQPRSSNINRENTDGCSALCSSEFVADGARVQKRRSRWNEAEDSNRGKYAPLHKEPRIHSESVQVSHISLLYGNSGVPSDQAAIINEEKHNNLYVNRSPNRMTIKYLDNNEQSIDEDVPPGFSPPHKASFVPSSASSTASTFCQEKCLFPEYPFEVTVGHPQERFVSRSPVSFGIPMHAVEHFGRQGEIAENWFVAAGIPFHPYPPLPPYPRDRRGPAPALSSMILNSVPVIGEGFQNNATYQSDQITFSTSASCMPDLELSAPVKQHHFQGTGGASNRLERRYFRQQKWINTKSRPPWVRGEAGRGNFGNI